jgi:hypothetical protein
VTGRVWDPCSFLVSSEVWSGSIRASTMNRFTRLASIVVAFALFSFQSVVLPCRANPTQVMRRPEDYEHEIYLGPKRELSNNNELEKRSNGMVQIGYFANCKSFLITLWLPTIMILKRGHLCKKFPWRFFVVWSKLFRFLTRFTYRTDGYYTQHTFAYILCICWRWS